MKEYLFFLLTLSFAFSVLAQKTPFDLPDYTKGQYEFDTVYYYFGAFQPTGNGTVSLGGDLENNFVTGVSFKLIIDQLTGSATYDEGNGSETMAVGDTLTLPVDMTANSGNVGFRVVAEGTPQVTGETYYCDLAYDFPSGGEWKMEILDNSQATCEVNQAQGIEQPSHPELLSIAPNPADAVIRVQMNDGSVRPETMMLYHVDGSVSGRWSLDGSDAKSINRDKLPSGMYVVEILNAQGELLDREKLILR